MKKKSFGMFIGSKKAYLYEEILPITISLIIIGIVLFTFSTQINSAKEGYEQSAPTLKNQFPISFVQSFLYIELNDSQKQKLSINNESYFNVKDLLQREYLDNEKEIFEQIRDEYILASKSAGLFDVYSSGPGDKVNIDDENQLLRRKEVPSLDFLSCLEDENYFFYLPYADDISSKLVVIFFRNSFICADPNVPILNKEIYVK